MGRGGVGGGRRFGKGGGGGSKGGFALCYFFRFLFALACFFLGSRNHQKYIL